MEHQINDTHERIYSYEISTLQIQMVVVSFKQVQLQRPLEKLVKSFQVVLVQTVCEDSD